MNGLLKNPAMSLTGNIEVSRDLSGGVRVKFCDRFCVMSPQDAVTFATGLFKAAGCEIKFEGQAQSIIRAPGTGLAS